MNEVLFELRDVQRLERSLLKDNTADLLRDYIVSGRVVPGRKLVERQVSAALGVSRMPIRDALTMLEQQGLIVRRSNGHFVVELSDAEARQLNQVRSPLELLAVEQALGNIGTQDSEALHEALAGMAKACARRDRVGFIRTDIEIHDLIWRASRNPYLQRTLTTILGPLQVVISSSADAFDWSETLAIHAELVNALTSHDREAALRAIRRHMESIIR